jgi:hypothetical protein
MIDCGRFSASDRSRLRTVSTYAVHLPEVFSSGRAVRRARSWASNSGQYVDLAIDDLTCKAVPEPSTLALVGAVALTGLRTLRRRAGFRLAP